MQRYDPNNNNSQLIREAKIGFSIVLLVVSTVGYWGYSMYSKYRTQIPDHVRSAPMAQMVGPDDYLRSLQGRPLNTNQQVSENYSADRIRNQQPKQQFQDNRLASFEEPESPVKQSVPPVEKDASNSINPISQVRSPIAQPANKPPPSQFFTRDKVELKPDRETAPEAVPDSLPKSPSHESKDTETVKPAPIVDPTDSDDGNSFVPLEPMPLNEVSSNDNKNTLNVAQDISKTLIPIGDSFATTPDNFEPQPGRSAEENSIATNPLPAATPDGDINSQQPQFENSHANSLAVAAVDNAQHSQPERPGLAIDQLAVQDIVVEIENPDPQQQTLTSFPKAPAAKRLAPDQYIARNGDSLWSVATEVYDDGRYFRALHHHNMQVLRGKDSLPAGTQIETPEVDFLHRNYPGLCPADKLENDTNDSKYITVEGDTLFGIARNTVGQASRYLEIYRLNRDRLPPRAGHLTRLPANIELLLPR